MASVVAIIGGGPAGAMAAERLAAAGTRVVLFDEKLAWEKPCGGGVTPKALERYPYLRDAQVARQWIADCELIGGRGRRVLLKLDRPIAIFSRATLNGLLLDRARRAGAEVIRERITGLERRPGGGWRLRARGGADAIADEVLLAAGARNPFRRQFELPLGPGDFATALGYFVPGGSDRVRIQFAPGLGGYLWTFPRADHISAGICGAGDGASPAALRRQLERFLDAEGFAWREGRFYAHLLPAPRAATLRAMRFAGPGWALAGDAASLVDPITGEGLYYALRSGELHAACRAQGPEAYAAALRRELLPELELAARIAHRFFHGAFLGGQVIDRMLQFTAASRRFQALMRDLFAGSQGYLGLKRRLYRHLLPTLAEVWAAR